MFKKWSVIIGFLGVAFCSFAQQSLKTKELTGGNLNTITTAVPFLMIAPDSRAGAMGDAGVSTSADVNSIHWNPAKLTFAEKDLGFGLSVAPWLKQIVNDVYLYYLSGYKKIDKMSAIGGSLRYFTLGDIQFTDQNGNNLMQFKPNEYAIDVAYSRILADNFSGGIALRYINSNLTGGQVVGQAQTKPGRAVAADVSVYYENDDIKILEKDATVAWGVNISNIGNKMSYSASARKDFIPINLRLGPRVTMNLDDYNSISLTTDINKLLVPTPPIYDTESSSPTFGQIIAGQDPERGVASGMFGSFTDAPGNLDFDPETGDYIMNPDGTYKIQKGSVFVEEMREINFSVAAEYWYGQQFAIRSGYFWEHALKGNRKFFTLGAGLKYNVFGLDFSYLIPAYWGKNSTSQKSPLQNTLRFTLKFDFEAFKQNNSEE